MEGTEDAIGSPSCGWPTPNVKYPPEGSFRHGATMGQWYANVAAGNRALQELKKISIVEAKGYCYGWHFYQCADADLVISSDDALFGHPSFRYYGWGPRMWTWVLTMGLRPFQEMVFTGRPFTADEMQACNFLNKVVARDQLEAEVEKYALACARNRPVDTVFQQKVFFEVVKQFQGEYMGSLLSADLRVDGQHRAARRRATSCSATRSTRAGRCGQRQRRQVPAGVPVEQVEPQEEGLKPCAREEQNRSSCRSTVTPSSTCPSESPAPTAPSCWPTAAPTSSKSSRQKVIRCVGGRRRAPRSPPTTTAHCSASWPARSTASSSTRRIPTTSTWCAACWRRPTRWCGRAGPRSSRSTNSRPQHWRTRYPHLTVTSITPFGLDGPWADKPATEFTMQAWSGGVIGLGRGAQDRAPLFVGGQVGEWLAGAYAAAGTMAVAIAAWWTCRCSKRRSSASLTIPCHSSRCWAGRGAIVRRLTVPGVATAADGLVALGCGTAQQWFDLCAMMGHDEWIDEDVDLSITEQANIHAERDLRVGAGEPRRRDSRDLSTAFRIPNAPVGNGANVTSFDHFVERGSFVDNPRDGFTQPGPPYRATPSLVRAPEPAPRLGEHTDHYRRDEHLGAKTRRNRAQMSVSAQGRSPFEGLRVLDMTTFWAGPSCTHVLAMLGAEVIHVESTARPDGTRLIAGVPITEDQWWEQSPIFSGLNTNKKSVTLDIRTRTRRRVAAPAW